ncbi:E3 ubiquitin-protein ligase [Dirofilaria immitis]
MNENNSDSLEQTINIASTMNITSYVNKDGFSTENAEHDSIRCEICFEPFDIKKRLPKLLPCEHNFCEQCIFSLCCHQQYYLLDSINCPTCHTEFNTSTALAATTNYELLETVQLQQMENTNDDNATIIHVPDSNCITRNRVVRLHSWHRNSGLFFGSKRYQPMQCTDCFRKMSKKKYRKEARFCAGCFSIKNDDDDCLRMICLECCVNRHNGHKLVTLSELEHEHQKLIKDLYNLQQSIQKTNKWLEASLKMLSENCKMSATDCIALYKMKQNLWNECEADMRFALSVLENGGTNPLPLTVLQRMRQYQYYNSAKLHKLLHFLEKCNRSINEGYNRSIKPDVSILVSHSSLFSLYRQRRITLCHSAHDDRSTAEAIEAVLAVMFDRRLIFEDENKIAIVEEAMRVLSKKSSTKTVRRAALLCCAKQLREFIDESINRQSIFLYIDAYFHIFYRLNFLVARLPSNENNQDVIGITRWDIWKLIQAVYSDLMRCAAKNWRSEESERVDLVDDLAFLCFLYSDVSDEATITICMIEASRARAAAAETISASDICEKLNGSEDEGQITMNIRLNLIDEHLLECRQAQKLQQLHATIITKSRNYIRQQSLKHIWKLLFACFDKSSRHQ